MVCPRCARENDAENLFCSRCGLEFAQMKASRPSDPGEAKFCYRHKKESTLLSCGKCGKPICHRCVVVGPAGTRCPDCARQNIPFSWRGFLAEARMGTRHLLRASPYTIYIYLLIGSMAFGLIRGCGSAIAPHRTPDTVEAPAD